MQFRGMEDRLNPIAPEDADEATVGGYAAIHGRSATFEGKDGFPYSVAIETERGEQDVAAYFVFLRWAQNSTAIMGHVESDDLAHGRTEDDARREAGEISLADAKSLLDKLIDRKAEWTSE